MSDQVISKYKELDLSWCVDMHTGEVMLIKENYNEDGDTLLVDKLGYDLQCSVREALRKKEKEALDIACSIIQKVDYAGKLGNIYQLKNLVEVHSLAELVLKYGIKKEDVS